MASFRFWGSLIPLMFHDRTLKRMGGGYWDWGAGAPDVLFWSVLCGAIDELVNRDFSFGMTKLSRVVCPSFGVSFLVSVLVLGFCES